MGRPRLFPDDLQFWFETLRLLGAADGLYDYAAPQLAMAPAVLRGHLEEMLRARSASVADLAIKEAMKLLPAARWGIAHGTYAMGVATPRAYLAASLAYSLKHGVAERISCPTLVCDPENDGFFKGQPKELYDHLTCRKTMLRFTEREGAGDHCQVGASRLAFARIYDWLDETLS
jgi:hypothetical protein